MKGDFDRPLILLTNDDGLSAAGLDAMAAALSEHASVVVIAPAQEQSACSHKLTLARALRLRRVAPSRYSLDGTPADCVYVGIYGGARVIERKPDLVVSGLNAGPNLGLDTYYSGTVAGAREAAMRGISGVAVSADVRADPRKAAAVGARIAIAAWRLSELGARPIVLNVNVPARGPWTLRRTTLGRRTYGEGVDYRTDPRGRDYLWLGGPGAGVDDPTPGTDTHAILQGEIGVTQLPLLPHEPSSHELVDAILAAAESIDGGSVS